MKKILIADDHSVIRTGVKFLLSKEFAEVEFGEAENSSQVLKKLNEKKWDMLIIDMDMPGRSGLEVIQQLKEEKSEIRSLMFSMYPENQIAVRALKSGASGYLSKNKMDSELVNAVRTILSGRKYISEAVAEQLANYLENPENKPPHELLSDREYQTLLLLAKGKTISEIADELSLSRPTVSTFRSRILEKMNMHSTAEVIKYALEHNLA